MDKLEQAKNAILDAIIETCKTDLGSNAEAFARGYAHLISAETQEKMTNFATCPDCDEPLDDFPQEIG
jgi:transcription initiation factor IIE alpha subunit